MAEVQGMACCGMIELNGISQEEPEQTLNNFVPDYWDDINHGKGVANVVFTAVVNTSGGAINGNLYGKRLANYIRRHKLGKVVSVPPAVNPNTRNTIQAWVWQVNRAAYKGWVEKRGWKVSNEAPRCYGSWRVVSYPTGE